MCTKLCWNVCKNCARMCTKLCWNVYKNCAGMCAKTVLECVQKLCQKNIHILHQQAVMSANAAASISGLAAPNASPCRLTCGKNFHTICFSSPAIWLPPVQRNGLCSYVGVCSAVGYLYSLRQRSVGQMTVLRLSGATRQPYCCHKQKYNSLHHAMTLIFMLRTQRYKKCIFANLCSENLHGGAFFRRGDLQMSEIFCTFVRHFVQKPRIIPCVEKILRS